MTTALTATFGSGSDTYSQIWTAEELITWSDSPDWILDAQSTAGVYLSVYAGSADVTADFAGIIDATATVTVTAPATDPAEMQINVTDEPANSVFELVGFNAAGAITLGPVQTGDISTGFSLQNVSTDTVSVSVFGINGTGEVTGLATTAVSVIPGGYTQIDNLAFVTTDIGNGFTLSVSSEDHSDLTLDIDETITLKAMASFGVGSYVQNWSGTSALVWTRDPDYLLEVDDVHDCSMKALFSGTTAVKAALGTNDVKVAIVNVVVNPDPTRPSGLRITFHCMPADTNYVAMTGYDINGEPTCAPYYITYLGEDIEHNLDGILPDGTTSIRLVGLYDKTMRYQKMYPDRSHVNYTAQTASQVQVGGGCMCQLSLHNAADYEYKVAGNGSGENGLTFRRADSDRFTMKAIADYGDYVQNWASETDTCMTWSYKPSNLVNDLGNNVYKILYAGTTTFTANYCDPEDPRETPQFHPVSEAEGGAKVIGRTGYPAEVRITPSGNTGTKYVMTGYGSDGSVLYGPTTVDSASTLKFTGVSTAVKSFSIVALNSSGTAVGGNYGALSLVAEGLSIKSVNMKSISSFIADMQCVIEDEPAPLFVGENFNLKLVALAENYTQNWTANPWVTWSAEQGASIISSQGNGSYITVATGNDRAIAKMNSGAAIATSSSITVKDGTGINVTISNIAETGADTVIVSGYDSSGMLAFGPASYAAQSSVGPIEVSASANYIRVAALNGNEVKGLYVGACSLSPGAINNITCTLNTGSSIASMFSGFAMEPSDAYIHKDDTEQFVVKATFGTGNSAYSLYWGDDPIIVWPASVGNILSKQGPGQYKGLRAGSGVLSAALGSNSVKTASANVTVFTGSGLTVSLSTSGLSGASRLHLDTFDNSGNKLDSQEKAISAATTFTGISTSTSSIRLLVLNNGGSVVGMYVNKVQLVNGFARIDTGAYTAASAIPQLFESFGLTETTTGEQISMTLHVGERTSLVPEAEFAVSGQSGTYKQIWSNDPFIVWSASPAVYMAPTSVKGVFRAVCAGDCHIEANFVGASAFIDANVIGTDDPMDPAYGNFAELTFNFSSVISGHSNVKKVKLTGYDKNGFLIFDPQKFAIESSMVIGGINCNIKSLRTVYFNNAGDVLGLDVQPLSAADGDQVTINCGYTAKNMLTSGLLTGYAVEPASVNMEVDDTRDFRAMATFYSGQDAIIQDSTNDEYVAWTMASGNILEEVIGRTAIYKAVAAGTETLTSNFMGMRSANAVVTVAALPAEVTPVSVRMTADYVPDTLSDETVDCLITADVIYTASGSADELYKTDVEVVPDPEDITQMSFSFRACGTAPIIKSVTLYNRAQGGEETNERYAFSWYDSNDGTAAVIDGETVLDEASNTFAGGQGTEAEPYLIANPRQLNNVNSHMSSHFQQIRDVDFEGSTGLKIDRYEDTGMDTAPLPVISRFTAHAPFYNDGKGWRPIGLDNKTNFTGTYDGGGFEIRDLILNITEYDSALVTSSATSCGLFSRVSNAAIENLKLDESCCFNTDVNAGSSSSNSLKLGGFAGYAYNSALTNLENAAIVVAFSNRAYAGGIAGNMNGATSSVTGCVNSGLILAYSDSTLASAGGIIGLMQTTSSVSECSNCGEILSASETSNAFAGGIAGIVDRTSGTTAISDCWNTGDLKCAGTGEIYAGGIAGIISNTSVANCWNSGSFTNLFGAGTEYVGGIIGNKNSNNSVCAVSNCFYLGETEGGMSKGIGNVSSDVNTETAKCTLAQLKNQGVITSVTPTGYLNALLNGTRSVWSVNTKADGELGPGVYKGFSVFTWQL